LWETFAASVNAERYGHPVEHYAQLTVIWLLFGAVVGAAVSGAAAAWLLRRQTRIAALHTV
jgi:HAMP domain-containing protein